MQIVLYFISSVAGIDVKRKLSRLHVLNVCLQLSPVFFHWQKQQDFMAFLFE